ncbi:hypothetical protein Dimus_038266 [Dionaea muscipula]
MIDFFKVFLGDWIPCAIELNVKVLGMTIEPSRTANIFELSSPVQTSNSIVLLGLFGSKLKTYYDIHLPQLQTLFLKRVKFPRANAAKIDLQLHCTLIQDVRLMLCGGLKNIVISSVTVLKHIDIYRILQNNHF